MARKFLIGIDATAGVAVSGGNVVVSSGYLDLSKGELRNAVIQNLGTAPGSPVTGQIYLDTAAGANQLKYWNGTAWKALATGSDVAFGSPTGLSVGGSNADGTASTFARSDHVHALPGWGNVSSQTSFGGSSANGTAETFARSDHTHGTPTHDDTAHSSIKLSALAVPTANISLNSYKITSLGTPTTGTDAATKAYVDSMAAGLRDFKDSVRAVSTTDVDLSTNAANGSTFGGVTLATGDRILVAGQSTASQNGIYVVKASGAPDRATDADESDEISVGTLVYVEDGTNGGQQWICSATTADPWVPASSGSTWAMFFAVTPTQAGNGLTASGNVLSVGAGTGISVGADTVGVDTTLVARKKIFVGPTAPGPTDTTWFITHSLGNRDVSVQVYDAVTYATVECDVVRVDANTVSIESASPISEDALRAVVIG